MLFHLPESPYQVGGSLPSTASTYVARHADQALLQSLLMGHFCYVFDARQMGKSSLRVRTMARLQQAGVQSLAIDLTSIGSQKVSAEQWYAAIAAYLVKGFQLSINLRQWWPAHSHLPVVARLAQLIETVLLVEVQQPIVILIDEIDSILGLQFPTDDFFALIRNCFDRRAEFPAYGRLTFALFGVTTPSDLISDKTRTPFNIGKAIDLKGFTAQEAAVLAAGLQIWVSNADEVLQRILYWTGGQPLLTQKLCKLVAEAISADPDATGFGDRTDCWVDDLVAARILDHWEMQDEPEHLRTIRDRLWYKPHKISQLLNLYQQVLNAEELGQQPVLLDESAAQLELLLVGLVDRYSGCLRVKNRICKTIFNAGWVKHQLKHLRPYSQALNAWVKSGYRDGSRLLRGQALQETLTWAQHQSLSEIEYRFLAASQEIDRQETVAKIEAERLQEVEARLSAERERGLEQQRSLRRQRLLLIGVSVTMLIATSLGFLAVIQSRRAALNEARAVIRTTEALSASEQSFEALLEAIHSQQQLQQLRWVGTDLKFQADAILERIVMGIHQRNQLNSHTAAVLAIDYSPDGQTIATAGVDRTVKLWHRDGRLLATFEGHQASVRQVKFSPDGKLIASAGDDGKIRLWTLEGELKRVITTSLDAVWGLDFCPEGQKMIVAGSGVAEIWDVEGRRFSTLGTGTPASGALSAAFSPDGEQVAIGGNNNVVNIWHVSGRKLQTLRGHEAGIFAITYSPDGELLVTGSQDRTIKLWQRDGTLRQTIAHHEAGVLDLSFSPDGQTFVSASYDKTLALWDRNGYLINRFEGHQAAIYEIVFSPDGQRLASAGADNVAKVWQVQNPFHQSLQGMGGLALGAVYSHDGQMIATTGADDNILLLSTQDATRRTLDSQQAGVISLSLHPTQDVLLSTGGDRTLKLWNFAGDLLQTIAEHDGAVMAADWQPQGNELVSAAASGQLYRWRLDGSLITTWLGHSAPIWDLTYSPDGSQFATASNDGTLKLWSTAGELQHTLQHGAGVWRVAFSPDGKWVVSTSGDQTAKIWRADDGSLLTTLHGHEAAVWGVAFSPDGSILATSSIDETVKLWTLKGELLATLKAHKSGIRSLAFHPDGHVLASAGDDAALVFWQLDNILQLEPLTYACNWVQDYLATNVDVTQRDRALCNP